jgi:phasin family protein
VFTANDMQKMFDPTACTQMMQKFWDMNQMSNATKKNSETCQKITNCTTETISSCCQQIAQMCQANLQSSIEYMRELSTAKSLDEVASCQAEWTKKCAQTCQSNAQELAETMQKCQTQCTDLITKMVSENTQYAQNATQNAAKNASNAVSSNNKN